MMSDMNLKSSILVVAGIFFVGIVLSVILYPMEQNNILPTINFPVLLKILFELIVYLISLFLFSNHKIKPALWLKGLLIILFFRVLFSIANGIFFFMFFAQPPQTFGNMYFEALYKCNYSFIIQVLLSPALAYPLLVAVITDHIEFEKKDVKEENPIPTIPPPPSIAPPSDWADEPAPSEEPDKKEDSVESGDVSAELLKELGLSELAESEGETVEPKEAAKVEKPVEKKEPEEKTDQSDIEQLLAEFDGTGFFKEEGSPGADEKAKQESAIDDILKELTSTEEPKETPPPTAESIGEPPRNETPIEIEPPVIEAEKKPPLQKPEQKPQPEEEPPSFDIELPGFEMPGDEKPEKTAEPEEIEFDIPNLDIGMIDSSAGEEPIHEPEKIGEIPPIPKIEARKPETEKIEPAPIETEEKPKPVEEYPQGDLLEGIGLPPPLDISNFIEEKPPEPKAEPSAEMEKLEVVADKDQIEAESEKAPPPDMEEFPDLDELLSVLSESDLPDMSFDEKPAISLDDLPPLPDYPELGIFEDEPSEEVGEQEPVAEKEAFEEKSTEPQKPSSQQLATRPTDSITISVRRVIDYGKKSEAAAVLDKLLRRGSDYKLQVPLSMILDQLENGHIVLTADYIYNQVPIELVNFISAEQGRDLQKLELMIPLADVMKQVSPSLIAAHMPKDQKDSHWASEAAAIGSEVTFEESNIDKKTKEKEEQ